MIPVLTRGQWATDFSEIPLAAGLQSHGWIRGGAASGGSGTFTDTTYVATAIGDGARGIVVDQSASPQYRLCRWSDLGLVGDFEFLALVQLIDHPQAEGGGGFAWILGNNTDADGYDWVFDTDATGTDVGQGTADHVHISEVSDGFYQNEGANQRVTLNTTDKFWVRGRKTGTTYGVKCWKYGTSEPASFQERTDATFQSTRYFNITTVYDRRFRVDWLAVAVGTGKTAPFPQG